MCPRTARTGVREGIAAFAAIDRPAGPLACEVPGVGEIRAPPDCMHGLADLSPIREIGALYRLTVENEIHARSAHRAEVRSALVP